MILHSTLSVLGQRTNAELLQHRSVIQAQNLSLKGTLLETEAELLSIKDRLYRAQESERDLREQLDRFVSRCACAAGSSDASPSVNREQVEVTTTTDYSFSLSIRSSD